MSGPRIVVVGGGLAGLTAGLDCADAGAGVTLLEARPRLGGATWSVERRGLSVDNGQHVFLRCFHEYLRFLKRVGAEDRVLIQERFRVPVLEPGRRAAWLRRRRLPAPLHLAPSLASYRPLALADRLRIAGAARRLAALDLDDPELDAQSFGGWLAAQGQSQRAIERFWDLFAQPALNLPAREASLALAAMVFKTGLLSAPEAGDVGYARVPLARVHAEPAARALERAGAEVHLRARVSGIERDAAGGLCVRLGERRLAADAVILAAPHDAAAELLPAGAGVDPAALRGLGAVPIVNLHVLFDRPVTPLPFAAVVGSPLQWVFDRTQASGLERGQYLAVSLSAADAYAGVAGAELQRRFEPELRRVFPAAREARIERFFVTCERAATFRQAPGSARLRPGPVTQIPGLYLAGAWTGTGWPATMEGAVRSGRTAAREALTRTGLARAAA